MGLETMYEIERKLKAGIGRLEIIKSYGERYMCYVDDKQGYNREIYLIGKIDMEQEIGSEKLYYITDVFNPSNVKLEIKRLYGNNVYFVDCKRRCRSQVQNVL